MSSLEAARRPIASRNAGWAIRLSADLARRGVTPNTISLASIPIAAVGGGLVLWASTVDGWMAALGWIGAAACVQLRLVCNLLDGMVAIEGGHKTPAGPLYNEFPDRIADTLLLVPVGTAAVLPWLGWCAALLAALTAYVRVFGGSLGLAQDFSGVMAKQRRMAVLTAGLVLQSLETVLLGSRRSLLIALAIITAGSLITCASRTRTIARVLNARSGPSR